MLLFLRSQHSTLARMFHADRYKETAKPDGARRVMKSDDGCMSTYCPWKISSFTRIFHTDLLRKQGNLYLRGKGNIPAFTKKRSQGVMLAARVIALKKTSGFTLLEVILAMAIMVLLAGAIYSISSAAIESTKETIVEQFTMRRIAGFLQITRNAFLNLPANGAIFLSNDSNNSIPDLNFENATGLFGIASLGGGTLTLSAQPSSDGTRTFSILRIPKNIQGNDLTHFYENASWVKLLPKVQKPHWSFFYNGDWVDEWPRGSGRPQLVRLEMEVAGLQEPLETIFYVPAIAKKNFERPLGIPVIPVNQGTPGIPPSKGHIALPP